MNLEKKNLIGLIFVILGGWLLLGNFGLVRFNVWEFIWPLVILGIGLSFEFAYFRGEGKSPGLLVPAGILVTIAINFLLNVIFGWHLMAVTWPLFILAPAVGLLQLYIFDKQDKGVLLASGIVGGIGLVFLAGNILSSINISATLGAFFVIAGGLVFFNGLGNNKEKNIEKY